MSHIMKLLRIFTDEGSNGSYYRAEDSDGDGKVELYGAGDYGVYVVVSATPLLA